MTSTPAPQGICDPQLPQNRDHVVVGALLPLSNPGAIRRGIAMQVALNIAMKDVNDAGGVHGKPVRLITYDSAGLPSRGETFAKRLIEQDCARVIVGIYHNNVALAVRDVAADSGVPLIIAHASQDEITEGFPREVFRVAPTDRMVGEADGEWLASVGDYNGDGTRAVLLVVESSNYGKRQAAIAEEWIPGFAFEVSTLYAELPTTDFSPIVARILNMERFPDVLLIHMRNPLALELQKQLMDAGIGPHKETVLVNGAAALVGGEFWQKLPEGAGTVVRVAHPWVSSASELGLTFAADYARYAGGWPETYAFHAYDALRLAVDAMNRASSLDPYAIILALEQSDIDLAGGHYSFPYQSENLPDGSKVPASFWHQVIEPPLLFLEYDIPERRAEEAPLLWPRPRAATAVDEPVAEESDAGE